MSLVHADDQIVKTRKDIGKGRAKSFFEFVKVELRIGFAVEDFADIEYKKFYFRAFFKSKPILKP